MLLSVYIYGKDYNIGVYIGACVYGNPYVGVNEKTTMYFGLGFGMV